MTLYVLHFQEDAQEEFGWKLVHGDVFRPPRKGMMLSVLLGSGLQIFFMTLITLGECVFDCVYDEINMSSLEMDLLL